MTPAEFKKKWAKVTAKETSAYQSHFDDLCRVLGIAPPLEADPAGDTFCYQKRVMKDAELFDLAAGEDAGERGFADVWKKGCFAWEYKGKKKNLDEAYKQLLRYRESLLNPPLLVVCDFDRYIVRTNFNGTVQEVHEFTNEEIDDPKILKLLRDAFTEPHYLRPTRTTAEVTEKLAGKIAAVARSLQGRESVELEDAVSRRELRVGQKKNLRIARFLNRVMFCFFAEDTGLLPKNLFSEIARIGLDDREHFVRSLEELFRVMSKGGLFGHHKIRHFNGHLFEEATVFELTDEEIGLLAEAAEADWQFIQPSIMGTLFERALEPEQRSQLGAHYTGEEDIKTLVEPVLMAPWRREWEALREEVRQIHRSAIRSVKPGQKKYSTSTGGLKRHCTTLQYNMLNKFVERLATVRVLDPACGSGNFLYVSLQLLLGLEKEVTAFGTEIDVAVARRVSVQQLSALEINPYAFELAQVSVQIGFLQWRRDNGFDNDRSPVLQNLDGFQNKDALLRDVFRAAPKDLQAAQTEEHTASGQQTLVYFERAWPDADVIVGNPPFLGSSRQWDELGREYCEALQRIYKGRVSGAADLCCYWFEKARQQIEEGKCQRAGLLGTQAIRGGVNREVLKRIKQTGDIFFAESDRDWILAGANVHVSMVGFDDGAQSARVLDGKPAAVIHSNLTVQADVTAAKPLRANYEISFRGTQKSGEFDVPQAIAFSGTKKSGDFDVPQASAVDWLAAPNPHGRPNSDLLRPWLNGSAIVKRMPATWIIDTGTDLTLEEFALYEQPHAYALKHVKPQRDGNKREHRRLNWWLHAETCPGMRTALQGHSRFLTTPRVSKFRIFAWADSVVLPDDGIYVFARSDDYFFGVVHSRLHEVWARSQGTQVRERESGFRYTPSSCFETFPFPLVEDTAQDPAQSVSKFRAAHYHTDQSNVLREEPPPATPGEHRDAIAAAAAELNKLRERWLNPPEWTHTVMLTFPGTGTGPWARYIDPQTVDPKTDIGTVRYPRLEPRDAGCAAKLKERTLTNLYNQRAKGEAAWLAFAHERLDAAVAAAYGWAAAMSDDQILENLLALNLARAAAEQVPAIKPQIRKRAARDEKQIEMEAI